MCGILALLLADTACNCRQEVYDGLTVLQHRGQDAAGIVTAYSADATNCIKFKQHKDKGLVRDVFKPERLINLIGNSGIGHVRYPTAGTMTSQEAQPMYINYPCGLALAHNGNLTNQADLSTYLQSQRRHLNTSSDSEVLLNVFAEELRKQLDDRSSPRSATITTEQIFNAVKGTMNRVKGGYSVVMLIHDVGVVGFRDPYGIRPLVLGKRPSLTLPGGIDYAMSSESVAFDILDFDLVRDVKPGECVLVRPMIPGQPRENLGLYSKVIVPGPGAYPCLFEYVYLARPDSIQNGISVYHARQQMGEKLARKIIKESNGTLWGMQAVIPVPETSRTIALRCAQVLGLPYCEGFIKNRYIARTFIMPDQSQRNRSIRLKLNTIKSEFDGRKVLVVDDSVVRGNTSGKLVKLAREAGALEVVFASAAPKIQFPNVYGIDLPTKGELVAHGRTDVEIAEKIGCDRIIFQDLSDLEDAVKLAEVKPVEGYKIKGFETSTFSGEYVTKDVGDDYFQRMESERSDDAKQKLST